MSYNSFKQTTKSVQHNSVGYDGCQVGSYYSGVGAGVGFGGAAGYGGGFAGDGFAVGGGYGTGAGGNVSILSGNEKETMQNLNYRLASYLDKVHELEAKNAELERKIKDWLDKHGPGPAEAPKDYSKYYKEIEDLNAKILEASKQNAAVLLQCDNARLAADDFKQKYESEHVLRLTVEADINGLHKVMDDLTMSKSELQPQVDSLTEELAYLKKNHDDEVKAIKAPETGKVSVEMNAAPSTDLTKILNDMRAQYEDLAMRNRKKAQDDFNKLSAELTKKIDQGQTTIVQSNTEVTTLKRTLQALQIELQSQLAQKNSLEMLLAETEGKFCMKLSHIQETIASLEERLAQLRADSECQKDEYQQLLDMKTKLEAEINTYKSLLDKLGAINVIQGQGQTQGQGQGQGQVQGTATQKP
ncbi:hypothetical protein XELAEV_18043128mg [Xenopus laevis]|uniref:IF rod domain-containing protein n=1 Tax=Xenopus laevis TaxID=8355 RepID=A0A974H220_XENLA|nr:hypothetical protein XELAEV_18043128mg [Xenopus laevis]